LRHFAVVFDYARGVSSTALLSNSVVRSWLWPRLLALLATLAAGLTVSELRASPADLFGVATESVARGGTGTATESGAAAAHLNPALLASGERQFRMGIGAARFELQGQGQGQRFVANDATGSAQFGLRLPLALAEPFADRLGLGLNVTTPGSVIARVRILDAERPQFPFLADRADSLNLDVGFGLKLPYDIKLGAGLMLLASLQGSVAIQAGGGGTVSSIVDDELVLTQAPLVGAAWAFKPFSFGAVYRGELRSEFDLVVTLTELGSIVLPELSVTGVAQYDPAQLQFEIAGTFASWELVAGASYKLWSRLNQLKGPTVRCPEDGTRCTEPRLLALGLRDTWVPRLGISRTIPLTRAADAQLRAGYFFEPTPLPAQRGESNLWDNPRHAFTAGYALTLRSPLPALSVALALQRHILVPRRHDKPTNVESSNALSSVTTRGSLWQFGLELEAPF
jgi:long-chain fatty acid transport protein